MIMLHLTTVTKSRVLASIVLSSLPLLAMCHRTAKRVDGLIAVGKYSEAAMRPNGSDDVIYSNGTLIQKPESNTPSFLRAH